MKYINTRWIRGQGSGSGLNKEGLKKLALNMHSTTSPRSNAMKPTLVISYDDSVQEDYTLAFPVHQQYGVPAEVNAISDFMLGQGGYLPDAGTQLPLTKEQALEMQDAGWEFNCHGKRHLTIGFYNLRLTSAEGSDRLYINEEYMHRFIHSFPFDIHLGRNNSILSEENTVISSGEDERGKYLQVSSVLKSGQYTFMRLSDGEMEREIVESTKALTEMGLRVNHHAAPYSASHWTARKIIKKYLVSARRGRGTSPQPIMIPGSNDIFPTYQMNCYVELTTKDETYLDNWLDEISSVNGLSIMMEHTWRNGFSPTGLAYIIEGALARGMDITTRTEALKRFGNLVELGDPFSGEQSNEQTQPYLIVDRTGKMFDNVASLDDVL